MLITLFFIMIAIAITKYTNKSVTTYWLPSILNKSAASPNSAPCKNSGVAIHWTITSSAIATKVNTESAIIFENSSTPRHFTCPPTLFI